MNSLLMAASKKRVASVGASVFYGPDCWRVRGPGKAILLNPDALIINGATDLNTDNGYLYWTAVRANFDVFFYKDAAKTQLVLHGNGSRDPILVGQNGSGLSGSLHYATNGGAGDPSNIVRSSAAPEGQTVVGYGPPYTIFDPGGFINPSNLVINGLVCKNSDNGKLLVSLIDFGGGFIFVDFSDAWDNFVPAGFAFGNTPGILSIGPQGAPPPPQLTSGTIEILLPGPASGLSITGTPIFG